MAAVVVAAAVDAAADVQVNLAQIMEFVEILVAFGDGFGHCQGARVGQITEIAARASNHVGQQTDIGARQTQAPGLTPQFRQGITAHPGQHQILVVRHAHFPCAVAFCQFSHGIELIGRCIAWRLPQTFERQRHRPQIGIFVRLDILLQPPAKLHVVLGCSAQDARHFLVGTVARGAGWRRRETPAYALKLVSGDGVWRTVLFHDAAVFGLHLVDVTLPFGLHQNLDAGLVDVVAPPPCVVDTHQGFQVIEDLISGQEFTHDRGNRGCSTHAATGQHPESDLVGLIAHQMQAHVVPVGGGAVFARSHNGNLELSRQEGELGVQRAPLAHDFGVRARVGHLVHGNPSPFIGGDVADAVAAGLNAVHVHAGQQVHHVGSQVQWNPVELHVLARGEVGIAGGQAAGYGFAVTQLDAAQLVLCFHRTLEYLVAGLVVLPGNTCQYAYLAAGQLAVRHRHTQHGRVALDVPAVLQA